MKDTKNKSTLKTALKIVILIAICSCIAFVSGKFSQGIVNEEKEINTVVLENRLVDIAELATLDYHYKDLGEYSDSKDLKGIKIPFTTSHFFVTFEGDIKMGIDASDINIEKTTDGFSVTVPEAKILSHEIDENSVEVFDEKHGVFNKLTVDDYNQFYASQKTRIENEVLEKKYVEEAHAKSIELVKNILSEFESEDVKIQVK